MARLKRNSFCNRLFERTASTEGDFDDDAEEDEEKEKGKEEEEEEEEEFFFVFARGSIQRKG